MAQLLFVYNLAYSYVRGKASGSNPWRACSLEWCTPETPPKHGNWDAMPVVHRWPYDFAVPGAKLDYTTQIIPASEVPVHEDDLDESGVPVKAPVGEVSAGGLTGDEVLQEK